jgi:hypothetical protein
MKKRIKVYKSPEEQALAQLEYYASLDATESMNLFFQLMNFAKKLKQKTLSMSKRKIVIKHDYRF